MFVQRNKNGSSKELFRSVGGINVVRLFMYECRGGILRMDENGLRQEQPWSRKRGISHLREHASSVRSQRDEQWRKVVSRVCHQRD